MADRDVVDPDDHIRVPFGEEAYDVWIIWLTPDEERGHYHGLWDQGLWHTTWKKEARP